MANKRILVVEDDEDIQELIGLHLLRHKFLVSSALTGEEALALAPAQTYDLILLDLMLPGIDGYEVARRLKADDQTKKTPIIMLTARAEEADIIKGLELGADDYITKPFSPQVLVARVKAVLRRRALDSDDKPEVISAKNMVIDTGRHEVLVNGQPVKLTLTEFSLLSIMAQRPGWVFTREQLIDATHGKGYAVTDRSVDVQIMGLRRRLGPAGKHIQTVRGVGYRYHE